MTSLSGAQQLAPLVAQYNAVSTIIAVLQQCLAAQPTGAAVIESLSMTVSINGAAPQTIPAQIVLSGADSQTLMQGALAVYQGMLTALQGQVAAIA